MLVSDQVPSGPDWIPRQLADLQRALRELQAARPQLAEHIPGAFASSSTPTDSTASASWTTLQVAVWRWQRPYLHTWVQTVVTSTTAEIRWRITTGPDADTVIGGPVVLANGSAYAAYGPWLVPGGWLDEIGIALEGRVASGAGTVAVRTVTATGIPTP